MEELTLEMLIERIQSSDDAVRAAARDGAGPVGAPAVLPLAKIAAGGELPSLDERSIELAAHNISVLGHMWTFRRWFFARHYTIEDYIKIQTEFILNMCSRKID